MLRSKHVAATTTRREDSASGIRRIDQYRDEEERTSRTLRGKHRRRNNLAERMTIFLILSTLIGILLLMLFSTVKKGGSSFLQNRDQLIIPDHDRPSKDSKASLMVHNTTTNIQPSFAIVITVTECQDQNYDFVQGAAILHYSLQGKSTYDFVAVLHPTRVSAFCREQLHRIGYQTITRDVFVQVSDIRGDFLRERIVKNGCCGETELLKMEAWSLTQYQAVVLCDTDLLFLQSIDPLLQLFGGRKSEEIRDFIQENTRYFQWVDKALHQLSTKTEAKLQLLYTIDYAMVLARRKIKPFQGGFVILRPNQTIYEEFREIVLEGDFRDNGGWGGQTGKFWGAMTFQGLLPYYFQILHPDLLSLELNRCIHDNMASRPREKDEDDAPCFTGETICEDCRLTPREDIVSFHFTNCLKPWHCVRHSTTSLKQQLCRYMHHAWFHTRSLMEQSMGGLQSSLIAVSNNTSEPIGLDPFLAGYCKTGGRSGYRHIQLQG